MKLMKKISQKILKEILNDNPIHFWEIGASGGLMNFFDFDPLISYTGFEPNAALAKKKEKYRR